MFHIHTLNYHLPRKKLPVKTVVTDIFDNYDMPMVEDVSAYYDDITAKGKLDQITIGDDVDLLDCYYRMIDEFFKKNVDADPGEVMHIVYPIQYQDRFTCEGINIPYFLLKEFGMNSASVINIDQNCATSLYSMGYLSKMHCEEPAYALILTSSLARTLKDRFAGFTVTGDAVGMAVMSTRGYRFKIIDSGSISEGTYSHNLFKKNGGNVSRELFMDTGVKLVNTILKKNNLELSHIKKVIPQTVNYGAYLVFAEKLKIPAAKLFLDNISNGGHQGDVDIIRNLKDYKENYEVRPGDRMLLYGVGPDGEKDVFISACVIQMV